MTQAVDLTIVIVNWNGGQLLRRCIESVLLYPPSVTYEILVVDNASTDDSLTGLASLAAPLRIIKNDVNLGFAKANNLAIAASQSPWLFLLNPDTEVRPGAIDHLLALLQSDPQIGVCAPRLLNPDNSLQPSVRRMPPTVFTIVFEGLGLAYLLPEKLRGTWLFGPYWDYAERRHVEFVSGAAMLVRRDTLNAVGAFDNTFELFGEDCELCLRIRKGGWWIDFEPLAEVLHYGNQSALKRWTPDGVRLKEVEGQILFQQRVLPLSSFILNQLAYLLVFVTLLGWRGLKRKPQGLLWSLCRLELGYIKHAVMTSLMRRASR